MERIFVTVVVSTQENMSYSVVTEKRKAWLLLGFFLQSELISFRFFKKKKKGKIRLSHHLAGQYKVLEQGDRSFSAIELLYTVSCWSVTLTTSGNEVTGQVPLSVGWHPTLTSC